MILENEKFILDLASATVYPLDKLNIKRHSVLPKKLLILSSNKLSLCLS